MTNERSKSFAIPLDIGEFIHHFLSGNTYFLHSLKSSQHNMYFSRFREGVKILSRRFKDRPLPPMNTAIYWIEYVARHGGAEFMRPASLSLRFYEYYLFDVAALIFIVLGIWAFISIYSFKICLRYLFESREISTKKKAL